MTVSLLFVSTCAGTTCAAKPNCRDGTGRYQAPTIALGVKGSDPFVCAIMSSGLDTGLAAIANGLPSMSKE